MANRTRLPDLDEVSHGAGLQPDAGDGEYFKGAPNSDQRSRNHRTGLTLAAIAAGFFVAVILRHVYFG